MPPAEIRTDPRLHPLHAILLAFPMALFSGALLSDITYLNSAEMQWSNFSAWLITGALLFGGAVLLWAAIRYFRERHPYLRKQSLLYLILTIVMWITGLINAFQHSQDGWSSVGTAGLLLSIVSTASALGAGWIAHSNGGAVR